MNEKEQIFNVAGTPSNPIKNIMTTNFNWKNFFHKRKIKPSKKTWYNLWRCWWGNLNEDELLLLTEFYNISEVNKKQNYEITCSPDTIENRTKLYYEIGCHGSLDRHMKSFGGKWKNLNHTTMMENRLKQGGYYEIINNGENQKLIIGLSEKGIEELFGRKNKFVTFVVLIGVCIPIFSSLLTYLFPIIIPFVVNHLWSDLIFLLK